MAAFLLQFKWFELFYTQRGMLMITYTYYVAEYYREGDPRPKYVGANSNTELLELVKKRDPSWKPSNDNGLIITVTEEVKPSDLLNHDYCTLSTQWYENFNRFCGKPVLHMIPLFKGL
jgi:hypothetical protein